MLGTIVGEGHIVELHGVACRYLRVIRHGKRGCGEHLVDALEGVSRLGEAAGSEHDLGERRREHRREHRVEREVGHEQGEVARRQRTWGYEQRCRHQKDEGPLGDGEIDRLRTLAHHALIVRGSLGICVDGFLERAERVDRLLEHLDHGNAAHVLSSSLARMVECVVVLSHEVGVLAAHHCEKRTDGNDRCQHAGSAHAPVKHEEQHKQRDEHGSGARNVGEVVGKERLGLGSSTVYAATQKSGCMRVEVA